MEKSTNVLPLPLNLNMIGAQRKGQTNVHKIMFHPIVHVRLGLLRTSKYMLLANIHKIYTRNIINELN